MLDELKFLAGSLIVDSNFSYERKKSLLDFVYKSTVEEEIKSLILDGDVTLLENDSKVIVNRRFDNLIENLSLILEQEPDEEVPEEQSKRKIPINPSSLVYGAMYLPSTAKASILAKAKLALASGGGFIGGAALAALLGFITYKIYKNFFDKASIECKGSPDREECIKNYKNKAIGLQIQQLQKGISVCDKSKNPDKCRESIAKKINKLKAKRV